MTTNLTLTPQHTRALDILLTTRKHVFITGGAGTGKSTLFRKFREETKEHIAVTAPTGVAAQNVEGNTIHKQFKIDPSTVVRQCQAPPKFKEERSEKDEEEAKLTTLVIDEVSMVRADLMDMIDRRLREIKGVDEPFGGVRLVFFGDMLQLPPVLKQGEEADAFYALGYKTPYFLSARCMQDVDLEFVVLKEVFRQSDAHFVSLLNRFRRGNCGTSDIATINAKHNPYFEPGDGWITLCTTNKTADEINAQKLLELKEKEHKNTCKITGEIDKEDFPAPEKLVFKVGAQVMLLVNSASGYVNGDIGHIVSVQMNKKRVDSVRIKLLDGRKYTVLRHSFELYKGLTSRETSYFEQFPFRLAWAITIHKSQGKTFDKVVISLGYGAFAPGQTYVALSRCRSLEGIVLREKMRTKDVYIDNRVFGLMMEWVGRGIKG